MLSKYFQKVQNSELHKVKCLQQLYVLDCSIPRCNLIARIVKYFRNLFVQDGLAGGEHHGGAGGDRGATDEER